MASIDLISIERVFFLLSSSDFSQWPLPSLDSDAHLSPDMHMESTKNQLNELTKKLQPIQQIILSFRPRQKPSFVYYIPDFGDDDEEDVDIDEADDNEIKSMAEVEDIDGQESLSDKLYQIFDQSNILFISRKRRKTNPLFLSLDQVSSTIANRSPLLTYKITAYLFVFVLLITHRISFTKP